MLQESGGLNREAIEARLADCVKKVNILQKCLFKYANLRTLGEESTVIGERLSFFSFDCLTQTEGKLPSSAATHHKRLSATLKIKILSCSALPGKKVAQSEVFFVFKIDGAQKAKSRAAKGKWNDEITLYLDRATEIEISVYEKGGGCLALIWLSSSMIAEGMIELAQERGYLPQGTEKDASAEEIVLSPNILALSSDGIDGSFEMEPSGRIHLRISLGNNLVFSSNAGFLTMCLIDKFNKSRKVVIAECLETGVLI